jgi:hypothetical protein
MQIDITISLQICGFTVSFIKPGFDYMKTARPEEYLIICLG